MRLCRPEIKSSLRARRWETKISVDVCAAPGNASNLVRCQPTSDQVKLATEACFLFRELASPVLGCVEVVRASFRNQEDYRARSDSNEVSLVTVIQAVLRCPISGEKIIAVCENWSELHREVMPLSAKDFAEGLRSYLKKQLSDRTKDFSARVQSLQKQIELLS